MKKRFFRLALFVLCALLCAVFCSAAYAADGKKEKPEPPDFLDLTDPQQDGLELLRKYHASLGSVSTADMTRAVYMEAELARVLLNETVLDRVQKLPAAEAGMMMRSHLAFLRHIRDYPISLYAETCREFRHDGSLRYCAVVNSEEERISIDRGGHLRDLNALYLCL